MSERSLLVVCQFGGLYGWGHVTRCAALASEARSRGVRTLLATPSDPSSLLPEHRAVFGEIATLSRSSYLRFEIGQSRLDASIVDDYAFSDEDLQRIRPLAGSHLLVIDDMKIRGLAAADTVLNAEIGLSDRPYADECVQLLGERYCPLRSGFLQDVPPVKMDTDGKIPVLFMMGGTDPFALSEKVLDALRDEFSRQICPLFVGEPTPSVLASLGRFPSHLLLGRVASIELASWMRFSRFGITGCGSSVYEFAACITRFIGLQLVENQTATAAGVSNHWGQFILPARGGKLDASALRNAVGVLLKEPASKKPYSSVDRFGAIRVLDSLELSR